ncbi:hypothetical protein KC19_4G000500 [Ceratodon purpureus]|uniref:Uncharacterized protein n=1 Tax=Ceratodon purpureus TaxID=3225 RepID=A0A8T0I6T4_CERPU|nr:hypothetical protein KC19_4G000500 [Ceratodon purpureus]
MVPDDESVQTGSQLRASPAASYGGAAPACLPACQPTPQRPHPVPAPSGTELPGGSQPASPQNSRTVLWSRDWRKPPPDAFDIL